MIEGMRTLVKIIVSEHAGLRMIVNINFKVFFAVEENGGPNLGSKAPEELTIGKLVTPFQCEGAAAAEDRGREKEKEKNM
eukprot:1142337-Pelagomonas_calceolata.AAC.1